MTAQPAWGTAPLPVTEVEYVVSGFYAATDQRVDAYYTFPGSQPTPEGARAAEDAAGVEYGQQVGDDGVPCQFKVTGVFSIVNGKIQRVDTAEYLDPDQTEMTTTEPAEDAVPPYRLVGETVIVEDVVEVRPSRWFW